jgi:hypothetical protein
VPNCLITLNKMHIAEHITINLHGIKTLFKTYSILHKLSLHPGEIIIQIVLYHDGLVIISVIKVIVQSLIQHRQADFSPVDQIDWFLDGIYDLSVAEQIYGGPSHNK